MDSTGAASLRLQLLGPLVIHRDGGDVRLPASRKLRALLAYLALAPRPVGRAALCELLWDGPDDPRGELRGALSKLRHALDAPSRPRVRVDGDRVWLDLDGDAVDALEVGRAIAVGIGALDPARRRALADRDAGEFLDGLEVPDSPAFGSWLTAQRRRFRGCQVALLESLALDADNPDRRADLERWLALAPLDPRAHQTLLALLAAAGQLREGEAHLAATTALFEAEGLDAAALGIAWRTARVAARPAAAIRATADDPPPPLSDRRRPHRASIAVMPFDDTSAMPRTRGGIADALAYDVTSRLARLRSLLVIAQGSVFALHERQIGPEEAGRMLDVDYVVGGRVQRLGERLRVQVELIETRSARLVWSEQLEQTLDAALQVLDDIGNRVVASIADEVEAVERNRAILRAPNSLNAWEAHHRGLWHMYRFTPADNLAARHFLEAAVRLDPTFARAHAALSFTHFQDAFQGWSARQPAIDRAYEAAGRSLLVDDRDPAAHWAMGRALWLRGGDASAIDELERSIDLSPNFSLAHYTLAFVHSQAGDPAAAITASDRARALSPFDPLLFGTLASRAMALARMGRYREAADWAVKAAARPNAHVHILAVAAYSLILAGAEEQARRQADAIRRIAPTYTVADFFSAFRFDANGQERFSLAAEALGMR